MKQTECIKVHCTAQFKERFERARKTEAAKSADVPGEADKGRELIASYCDRVLLPADHPRNRAGVAQ